MIGSVSGSKAEPGRTGSIVGIDTGGTFTDVTMLDPASGTIWTAKTPSTPDDPSRGFGNGLAEVLEIAQQEGSDVARVLHATTVATNLILEGKGSETALLVTNGFKYVIEIARQGSPRGSHLHSWIKPDRPIRPSRIWEIEERTLATGKEHTPLDREAVVKAARAIAAQGVRAITIAFINSYANPAHEREAAEVIREVYPEALISVSADVIPVFREYERTVTANLNSYVMAAVSTYVEKLERRVEASAIAAPLLLMKSSGGVASARAIHQRPVETALSGPAAGIVGARFVSESAGVRDIITVDIGGTSADISLISGGELGLTSRGQIGNWPIALPMVDVTTIGAGGGSIARVSDSGMLTVGPESAGAVPGPVCYRRGGAEPCVTDAHLVLGHLPPHLLGGAFSLDLEGAREAVRTRIAEPLGISMEEAAQGILDIADNNMMGAIRLISVERGFDPRDFVLVPFGGAGPLHGGSLSRLMGIRSVLVPPNPGVLSALGLLVSDLKAEFSKTSLIAGGTFDAAVIQADFAELVTGAEQWFIDEQIAPEARAVRRLANMRYKNQGFELTVEWPGETIDADSFACALEEFHVLHMRLYSFDQRDTPVEVTTLRVEAIGMFAKPVLSPAPTEGNAADAVVGSVSVWLPDGVVDAPVYDRLKLGAGAEFDGPCVVTQHDTTTYMLPRQRAVVHPMGSLIITDQTV